jgi:signal transduction histidine kinase
MKAEAFRQASLAKAALGVLALAVLCVFTEVIYGQWNAPVPEFSLNFGDGSTVSQVIPGSGAESAGLQAGDVIQRIDSVPFDWSSLATFRSRYADEKSIRVTVTRNEQWLDMTIPLVPAGQLYPDRMLLIALVVVLGGIISILLLWRFIQKPEVPLLYMLALSTAAGFLLPAIQVTPWMTLPTWQIAIAGLAASLSVLLTFHFAMTFPVKVGRPLQRRVLSGFLIALGLAMAIMWLLDAGGQGSLIGKFATGGLLALIFVLTGLMLPYSYARPATPFQRRQLRLVIPGLLLSIGPSIFLYSLPRILLGSAFIPEWLAGACLLAGLSSCVYVTLKQNLARIDQILNRTVVNLAIFTVILIILVLPVLFMDQILPDEWIIHAFILAGLTLLVAFSYAAIRQRVQQRVDIFFYGGWYDYPRVIDTVSAALAHSLKWEELDEILTRQVPNLMNLTGAWLAAGDKPLADELPAAQPQIQIPLRFEENLYATWLIGPRRDSDVFSASDRSIFATLTPQIEVALSNILHIEKLREQLEDIRASEKAMIKMGQQLIRSRDQEQERLSRELHDGPLQVLVGMNLQLGLMLSKTGAEQAHSPVGDTLSGLQLEVRSLMTELREVCTGLRPPMLDTLGLSSALRALVENWAAEERIPVRLELPPDDSLSFLTGEVALNLYRVVQEALTNIARHAAASQVSVCLTCDSLSEVLTLTIQDDGKGFEPKAVYSQAGQNHFGLAGMQERVRLIGGYWTLSSAPGCGTTIRVTRQVQDWQNPGAVDPTALLPGPG